ncbi:aminodeoxychorismate lyase [Gilvimarinus sp. SDUM040013]|uniref:Aminodeoxychorismate lyase n=1 Tax=Gilvimarinus gilvus TaxID=3058038 RepID=A0ABU4RYW9_9GAMM|nr:aminodeoxychorismate lyase [Gilvimarinus sp. SDUM040013]MDO3385717.1 aminodeoxychorismate lyase [Gilvimarinus sp. SDUM040013]MDX6849356.1 aminodeoxychorismate lyase [Gilvimarinus sp. SDUM040013]
MTTNQSPKIWVDGVMGERLSPLDRGFAYGDGLFETCRIADGCIPLWSWHLARLCRDLARLNIDVSRAELERLVRLALADSNGAGIVKIVVTRAASGRGYQAAGNSAATVVVMLYPHSRNQPKHYRIRICNSHVSQNSTIAGMKHLCRLENVLARSEWSDETIHEGLMLDRDGYVIEGTAHNVFVITNGELVTPTLNESGVRGVMRQLICEQLAPALDISVREAKLQVDDVMSASEVFFCNSNVGVVAVTELLSPAGATIAQYSAAAVAEKLQRKLTSYVEQQSRAGEMRGDNG